MHEQHRPLTFTVPSHLASLFFANQVSSFSTSPLSSRHIVSMPPIMSTLWIYWLSYGPITLALRIFVMLRGTSLRNHWTPISSRLSDFCCRFVRFQASSVDSFNYYSIVAAVCPGFKTHRVSRVARLQRSYDCSFVAMPTNGRHVFFVLTTYIQCLRLHTMLPCITSNAICICLSPIISPTQETEWCVSVFLFHIT